MIQFIKIGQILSRFPPIHGGHLDYIYFFIFIIKHWNTHTCSCSQDSASSRARCYRPPRPPGRGRCCVGVPGRGPPVAEQQQQPTSTRGSGAWTPDDQSPLPEFSRRPTFFRGGKKQQRKQRKKEENPIDSRPVRVSRTAFFFLNVTASFVSIVVADVFIWMSKATWTF